MTIEVDLLRGMEMSLAELVESISDLAAPERAAALERALAVIGETLARLIPVPVDLTPLIDAVNNRKAPVVNVQVAAPVVNFTTPEQTGARWEVNYPTIHGPQTMTIKRVA